MAARSWVTWNTLPAVQLAGSNVLLTGATGGLGQAIARALASEGATLVLSGRRTEVLEPLATELGARAVAVDLSRRDDVHRLVEEAGSVDVLVANAALPGSGRLSELTEDQIDRVLEVNLAAPIALTHALTPAMVQRGRGHLVFIASTAGKVATALSSTYNASKFGLRGFAFAMRAELAGAGVGVSLVSPGFISDAGMFAEAGVKLPPGVGTRSPEQVARAVVRAIKSNRAEIDVAPLGVRAGSMLGMLAPELAARTSRRLGAERIAERMAAGQADKR